MSAFIGDVRYGIRSLVRSPVFALLALAFLGLGIGAMTSVFEIVDAVIFRAPSGVREPGQVVHVYLARREGKIRTALGGGASYPDYSDLRSGTTRVFKDIAAFATLDLDFGRGPGAERVNGAIISGSYFSTLGVRPVAGRFFSVAEDGIPAANAVAVISYGFWQRRFGGDSRAIGRRVYVDGHDFVIAGVAPRGFEGVEAGRVDVWIPMMMASSVGLDLLQNRFASWLKIVGRLRPGVSRAQANGSAMAVLRHAAETVEGLDRQPQVAIVPLTGTVDPARGRTSRIAVLLLAATAILLGVVCVNVANLLLARATRRQHETAVRIALGATPGRLIRQMSIESVLLALVAGGIGVAGAAVANLGRYFPRDVGAVSIDWHIVAFAIITATVTALAFGLWPAVRAGRIDPSIPLKDSSPSVLIGRRSTGERLVAAQVALSLVLLSTASAIARSFANVSSIDVGVDSGRLLLITLALDEAGYSHSDADAFYVRALERLGETPGVDRASVAQLPPFGSVLGFEGSVPATDDRLPPPLGPYVNYVGPAYFATVGTHILQGRDFSETDRSDFPSVVVVNQEMANAYWPDANPLGRCIRLGSGAQARCAAVVGVASTGKYMSLEERPIPFVFLPLSRRVEGSDRTILVRTSGAASDAIPKVRRAISSLAPDLPYVDVQSMSALLEPELLPYKVSAEVFSALAGLSLCFATFGFYGLTSYVVAQRRHEIGVRIALGARPGEVVRLMLRRGLRPIVIGVIVGIVGAVGATEVVRSQLYNVRPADPISFVAALIAVAITSLLACYIPARRVRRVDPVVAIRLR